MFTHLINYWQTLNGKKPSPRNKSVWWVVKIVLAVLRLICDLIDHLGGDSSDR